MQTNLNNLPPCCDNCQALADTKCDICQQWNCKDCIVDLSGNYSCKECYTNKNIPETRETCVSCEYVDNIEEGADCHKCHCWTCAECASFGDDGNYYCVECST